MEPLLLSRLDWVHCTLDSYKIRGEHLRKFFTWASSLPHVRILVDRNQRYIPAAKCTKNFPSKQAFDSWPWFDWPLQLLGLQSVELFLLQVRCSQNWTLFWIRCLEILASVELFVCVPFVKIHNSLQSVWAQDQSSRSQKSLQAVQW